MEGPTKGAGTRVGEIWSERLGTQGTQKRQGRAAVLTMALRAGKGLGQTVPCLGPQYGKVTL